MGEKNRPPGRRNPGVDDQWIIKTCGAFEGDTSNAAGRLETIFVNLLNGSVENNIASAVQKTSSMIDSGTVSTSSRTDVHSFR